MAPAAMMASSAISHSGRFSATSATRSPVFTPNPRSPRDNSLMRVSVSRQLSGL